MDRELTTDWEAWFEEPLGETEKTFWDTTKSIRKGHSSFGQPNIVQSFIPGDTPLFNLLALLSAAAGVRSRGEILLVLASHVFSWFLGFQGVDAMYSVAAGFLTAKGRYAYAAFPTFLDVYTTFQNVRRTNWDLAQLFQGDNLIKFLLYGVGFAAAQFKFI